MSRGPTRDCDLCDFCVTCGDVEAGCVPRRPYNLSLGQSFQGLLAISVFSTHHLILSLCRMSDQGELAFVKKFAETIGAQPVNYADDFQPPLEDYLPRVPTLPVRPYASLK